MQVDFDAANAERRAGKPKRLCLFLIHSKSLFYEHQLKVHIKVINKHTIPPDLSYHFVGFALAMWPNLVNKIWDFKMCFKD